MAVSAVAVSAVAVGSAVAVSAVAAGEATFSAKTGVATGVVVSAAAGC